MLVNTLRRFFLIYHNNFNGPITIEYTKISDIKYILNTDSNDLFRLFIMNMFQKQCITATLIQLQINRTPENEIVFHL